MRIVNTRNMHTFEICLFVFLMTLSTISRCSGQKCQSCSLTLNQPWDLYPIPQAMTLRDFIYYYGSPETRMSELYYVTIKPKPFEPYYNYRLNYTALPDSTIREQIEADDLALNGGTAECKQIETRLVPVIVDIRKAETVHTANFLRNPGSSTSEMQTFWSSCPSKYVWTMKCQGWRFGDHHCPRNKMFLELSVPKVGQNAPDNIPWTPILRDLQQADLVFGAEDLYWAYTYGESTLCT